MEYKSKKLRKCCLEFEQAKKAWGKEMAKKVMRRRNEIEAAPTLDDLNRLPPTRCHPLTENRKGQFAVDLKNPFRLIFIPIGEANDIYINGVLDLKKVVGVKILEVCNYY